jgi:hypothetical protein
MADFLFLAAAPDQRASIVGGCDVSLRWRYPALGHLPAQGRRTGAGRRCLTGVSSNRSKKGYYGTEKVVLVLSLLICV